VDASRRRSDPEAWRCQAWEAEARRPEWAEAGPFGPSTAEAEVLLLAGEGAAERLDRKDAQLQAGERVGSGVWRHPNQAEEAERQDQGAS
jgi:hypothetical protein